MDTRVGHVDLTRKCRCRMRRAKAETVLQSRWEAILIELGWPRHPLLLAPPDELGLVRDREVELPEPDSPWHGPFLEQCKQLYEDFRVRPLRDATSLARRLRESVGGLDGAKVLGVYGGAGSGRSTVVLALALALQGLGRSVAILDADLAAPTLKPTLGLSAPPLLVGSLVLTLPWQGIRFQSLATFWPAEGPLPWQGQGLDTVLRRFRDDVVWGRPDVLLLDLPPLGDPRLEQVMAAFAAVPIAVRGPLGSAAQAPVPLAVIGQAGGAGDVQLPYAPPGERLVVFANLLRPFAEASLWNGSGRSH